MPSLRLEPFDASHGPALRAALDDPAVAAFTPVAEPVPDDVAERWLALYDGNPRRAWAAMTEDGAFAGIALAPVLDRDRAEAELGYVVAPELRGRGVATEMLRWMTDWALAEGFHRITLRISVGNEASKRVAQRVGYRLEGVLRSTYLKPGRRDDTEIWSLLATDPR